jgi:hypothetical protein
MNLDSAKTAEQLMNEANIGFDLKVGHGTDIPETFSCRRKLFIKEKFLALQNFQRPHLSNTPKLIFLSACCDQAFLIAYLFQ